MLLDTHVMLWVLEDSPRLGPRARHLIMGGGSVHVSSVSIWEVAIKSAQGKISVRGDLVDLVEAAGLTLLDFTSAHAWATTRLTEGAHRDPFDRALVAQARCERLSLVTADRVILDAGLDQPSLVDAHS